MKKLFYLFLSFMLSSCGLISSDNPDLSGSYFPLSIGNKWEYTNFNWYSEPDDTVDFIREVVGRSNFYGKEYFIIKETTFLDSEVIYDSVYFRLENNKLFKGYPDCDTLKEYLIADFSMKKGDDYYGVISRSGNEYQYHFWVTERTDNSITFFFDIEPISDEETRSSYSSGIGLTEKNSVVWGAGYKLKNYYLK